MSHHSLFNPCNRSFPITFRVMPANPSSRYQKVNQGRQIFEDIVLAQQCLLNTTAPEAPTFVPEAGSDHSHHHIQMPVPPIERSIRLPLWHLSAIETVEMQNRIITIWHDEKGRLESLQQWRSHYPRLMPWSIPHPSLLLYRTRSCMHSKPPHNLSRKDDRCTPITGCLSLFHNRSKGYR